MDIIKAHEKRPSSFVETGSKPSPMEALIEAAKVDAPGSWTEAEGFPTDPTAKEAYADLDKSQAQFMKLKEAYLQTTAHAHADIQAEIAKAKAALATDGAATPEQQGMLDANGEPLSF